MPMVPTPRIELDSFALQANVITRPTQLANLGGGGESRTPDFRLQAECVPASTTPPWRERWELNPLERVPQTRAAPFGFSPHLEPVVGAYPTLKRIQAASTFEVTGSVKSKPFVTFGVLIQIRTPLIYFSAQAPQ